MRKKHSPYKPLNETVIYKKADQPGREQRSEEAIYTDINIKKHSDGQHSRQNIYAYVAPQHKRAKHLCDEEIVQKIKDNEYVQGFSEETTRLSKVVFGKSNVLQKKMDDILRNPDIGRGLSREILGNPRSCHGLAGYNFCGFRTKARIKAEKDLVWLCAALDAYIGVVRQMREQLTYTHGREEKRLGVQTEDIAQHLQKTKERRQDSQEQRRQLREHTLSKKAPLAV
ncbi:BID domain-containing T4SS effector [Bartonella taylorii]|uniref:BID domain-containing T4SS effector n=1 Tax=Bartonella taylorii TaxID=33046 RepID=UPI001ABA382D|nr:BID domain-containing T4SS effector [Bartonella taylorii]